MFHTTAGAPFRVPAPDALSDEEFTANAVAIRPALYRYARRLSGHMDCEDLVQDALLRAWNARTSFQRDTNFTAWVFTILRNVHISEMRRARSARGSLKYIHSQEAFAFPDQEYSILTAELLGGVAALSPELREAFLTVAEGESTYQQLAQEMKIPAGTLKTRVHRARRALQKAILEGPIAASKRTRDGEI